MAARVITKMLGGEEDLAMGEGTVIQARAGGDINITLLNVPKWVANASALTIVDTSRFVLAKVGHSSIPYRWVSGDSQTPDGDFVIAGTNGNWLKVIEQSTLKDYSVLVHDVLTTSGLVAIDVNEGNIQEITLSGSITISLVNPAPEGFSSHVKLIIHQDSYGGSGVSWPPSIKWPGSVTPILSSSTDVIELFTTDNGVTWYGKLTHADIS